MAELTKIDAVKCLRNEGTVLEFKDGNADGVAVECADAYIVQNTGTGEATVKIVAGSNPRGAAEDLDVKVAASGIAVLSLDSAYYAHVSDVDGTSRKGCITIKSPATVKYAPVFIR